MKRTPVEFFTQKLEEIEIAANKQRTLLRRQFDTAIEEVNKKMKIDIAAARAEFHAQMKLPDVPLPPPTLDPGDKSLDVNALPLLLKMPQAVKISGISRSELYLRKASGELECRHVGRSILIVTRSLLKMVENLPE